MVALVEPTSGNATDGRRVDTVRLSTAMAYGWMDWVVPNDDDIQASRDNDLSAGPLGGFAYDPSNSSGLTVRIDTGEAFAGGGYLASDDTSATYASGSISQDDAQGDPIHDVELAASTSNQTVYLGHNPTETDGLIIGLDTAFVSSWPKTPLYSFDTDASGVTNQSDGRQTDRPAEQFVSKNGGSLSDDLDMGGNALLNVGVLSGLSSVVDFADSELHQWSLRAASTEPGDLGSREIWEDTSAQGSTGANMLKFPTAAGMRQIPLEYVQVVIDGFEDGDFAEYTVPSNTGSVSITSASEGVYEGTYGMRLQDYIRPRSMSGLRNYPKPGDMFELYVKFDTISPGSAFRFYFGKQTDNPTDDQYELHMYDDGAFRIEVDSGGSNSPTGAETDIGSYDEDVWYRVRIWWQHSDKSYDLVAELQDMSSNSLVATIHGNDTTFGQGGIMFFSGNGTTTYVDNLQIPDQA